MGVAALRRSITRALVVSSAAVALGASPPEQEMLSAFGGALTAMAYAGSGLCLFSIVWAGFVLMAEGGDERGGGASRKAVVGAVVGLVLVLSARGVAALLSSGLVPIPAP